MADNEPTTDAAPNPEPEQAPELDSGFQPITSQGQLERILGHRLKQQRAQYADYDELKQKAAQFDEIEAAQKSELERAQARISDLERQGAAAAQQAQEFALRSAIVTEAAKRNVVDPEAAVALIDRSVIEFDEDGSPKNVSDALDSLLEVKQYLVGGPQARGNADQGARGGSSPVGQLTRADLKSMTSAEIVKAQAEGRLKSVMAGEA